jgi:hypothetical protein
MRYLKVLALALAIVLPAALMTQAANAQVSFGVGVGPYYGDGYAYGPPVCTYGYYAYYPYSCAPYGYYGPEWFTGGLFIGAGPWYHTGFRGGYYGRGYYPRGYAYGGRGGYVGRGYVGNRGYVGGGARGYVGGGARGYAGGGARGFSGGGARGFSGGGARGGGGGGHFSGGGGHGGGGRR